MSHMTEGVNMILERDGQKGYRDIAVIVKPIIPYKVVSKMFRAVLQSPTIKVREKQIVVLYISPQPSKGGFEKFLNAINSTVEGRTIIMGDLKARHTLWDKASNCKGNKLVKWGKLNDWNISTTNELTLYDPRGETTPDIFLSKGYSSQIPLLQQVIGRKYQTIKKSKRRLPSETHPMTAVRE